MKIEIPKRENPNLKNYKDEDLRIVYKFAGDLKNELGTFVKGIIVFGSTTRHTRTFRGDIDILVVIDDLSIMIGKEISEAYRIIVEKITARISPKLHIITLRFSSFWEYVRDGDPIIINILRDGVAIYDSGFFDPLQVLLKRGRIRPSRESVWAYFLRAPTTLHNSKWHLLQATVDLYWACIDSAHSALMKLGEIPPTPEHVPDLLHDRMVKKHILEQKYVTIMRNFYRIAKMIEHHEIHQIKGEEYDRYNNEAIDFVTRMRKFIETK